ncbi:hypothetical protein [Microbulbifer sp. THAF38]|uniref:hypothetical protein n=1 Tax=Microbulbifer sp. THAF38 TaxID=2587856 RepID=UPI00126886E3|nr:hypothetical protein [Microbulbifer sp. THAF38]QFT56723.1 hypothetical protein FIU95_19415 [Microbulbifer sp. THAF38]
MDLILISCAVFLLAFIVVKLMDYPMDRRKREVKEAANSIGYKFYADAVRDKFDIITFDVLFLNRSGSVGGGDFEYLISNGTDGVLENRIPRGSAFDYRSNVYFSRVRFPCKLFIGTRRVSYNRGFFERNEDRSSKKVGPFMVEKKGSSISDKSLMLILEVLGKYSRPYVLASNGCLLFYDEGKTIKPSDLEGFISDGKKISGLIPRFSQ